MFMFRTEESEYVSDNKMHEWHKCVHSSSLEIHMDNTWMQSTKSRPWFAGVHLQQALVNIKKIFLLSRWQRHSAVPNTYMRMTCKRHLFLKESLRGFWPSSSVLKRGRLSFGFPFLKYQKDQLSPSLFFTHQRYPVDEKLCHVFQNGG